MDKGLLVILSGPSGAGKSTIFDRVIAETGMKKSISVTTREPRNGEVDGVAYHFRTVEQYRQMIADGAFLETAEVHNNFYGTLKKPVFENLEKGNDMLFDIDFQGAQAIKKKYPDAVAIFIMTPDFETLERRLRARGTEKAEALKTRLDAARYELSHYKIFDHIVFNDKLEVAIDEVLGIITSEKCRIKSNVARIEKLLKK